MSILYIVRLDVKKISHKNQFIKKKIISINELFYHDSTNASKLTENNTTPRTRKKIDVTQSNVTCNLTDS